MLIEYRMRVDIEAPISVESRVEDQLSYKGGHLSSWLKSIECNKMILR